MVGAEQHAAAPTTEEKVQYLRRWAIDRANGDPTRLPAIREAKVEVFQHFGGSKGAGLQTDIVTRTLRVLRAELAAARAGAQPRRDSDLPPERLAQLTRLAQLALALRDEGIAELEVSPDGEIVRLRRF